MNLNKLGSISSEFAAILPMLLALPARSISRLEREIREVARLYEWQAPPTILDNLLDTSAWAGLEKNDDLKYLFVFHGNGRLRERALDRISGALPTPFCFAAIVWRLNDWAAPVREAAVRCADRTFSVTSPEVIAAAMRDICSDKESWGRWGDEKVALDQACARTDVLARFSDLIIGQKTGSALGLLRQAMRYDGFDPFLELIALGAAQASARAVAFQVLFSGKARWPDGFEWEWVDKSMGLNRRVIRYRYRAIEMRRSLDALAVKGAVDRSAIVRKQVLEAAIMRQFDMSLALEIAGKLVSDRCRPVRERAEFLLRKAADSQALVKN